MAGVPEPVGAVADPIRWSLDGALALRFPASRSQAYETAVATARAADHYAETYVGKTLVHWCGFGRSREQLARALSVVHATHSIRGFELYAGGQMVADWYRVEAVLRCAMQAGASTDVRAHCVVMVTDAFVHRRPGKAGDLLLSFDSSPTLGNLSDILDPAPRRESPLYAFPCRYLLDRQFRFQPDHPSSEDDQVRAGAVRHGCDWCPHFSTTGAIER